MPSYWNKFFLIFISLFAVLEIATAQPKTNSPYSRIGLGDLVDQNFANAQGMAGLSAAFHDPHHLNILNPASNSHLASTAFEIGVFARYAGLEDTNTSLGVWSGNIDYIALGFPMKNPINKVLDRKKSPYAWGMSFALIPFSRVGYNVETVGNIEGIDDFRYLYQGSGGSYKLYWGNSLKYKNISVGVNLGYFFGKIENDRAVFFDDLQAAYQNVYHDEIGMSGFIWNVGAQYDYFFKEKNKKGELVNSDKSITIGAYGNSTTGFTTKTDRSFFRENPAYNARDTIYFETGVVEEGVLPAELSVGVMFTKRNKFKLGLNYSSANWGKYENGAKPETLSSAQTFSIGGEYIPQNLSYNSYYKQIRYRFGAFYSTDPRSTLNKQLTQYGITFGFGLPIILPRQQTSFVNLAFELGQLGTTESLQETYFKATIGFTLNDNTWFYKQKFK